VAHLCPPIHGGEEYINNQIHGMIIKF